jgi:hypothetical protein
MPCWHRSIPRGRDMQQLFVPATSSGEVQRQRTGVQPAGAKPPAGANGAAGKMAGRYTAIPHECQIGYWLHVDAMWTTQRDPWGLTSNYIHFNLVDAHGSWCARRLLHPHRG